MPRMWFAMLLMIAVSISGLGCGSSGVEAPSAITSPPRENPKVGPPPPPPKPPPGVPIKHMTLDEYKKMKSEKK